MRRRSTWMATLCGAIVALSACQKSAPIVDAGPPPPPADHDVSIHGLVTNATTHAPLSAVKITLFGAKDAYNPDAGDAGDAGNGSWDDGDGGDAGPPLVPVQTTYSDSNGFFHFTTLPDAHNLLIRYEMDGFATLTKVVNEPAASDTPCPFDAGVPCNVASSTKVIDASAELVPQLTLKVGGWVYAGTSPANGAEVDLVDPANPATPVYKTLADMQGHFYWPAVVAGTYQLVVLPFDDNGDGISDYQLATVDLGTINTASTNLTNIVVTLQDVHQEIVGGSFVNLSTPYPLQISDLMAGVTGVEANTKTFTLHFGAEVDTTLTAFELYQYDQISENGQVVRHSAPIQITTSWDRSTIATITVGQDLTPSVTGFTSYELRITALRFRDGTIAIPPSPTHYGLISFTIQQLPTPLPSPVPSWYLTPQATPTQAAAKAVVDASNVWLLDGNGDFVFGPDPATNWGPNNRPQLQWPTVAGAVRYHVWGRTVNPGPLGTVQQWQEVADPVPAPVPELSPTLATTIDPYRFPVVTFQQLPWAFGESVQFAVTCEDAAGFQGPIDLTKVFTTTDTFGGLVLNVAIDPATTAPFAPTAERGVTFTKTFRLDFSEPMNPQAPPTIAATGRNVRVNSADMMTPGVPQKVGWGDTNAASSVPLNSASSAYATMSLTAIGPCTEVLIDRFVGDAHIQVRDGSLFPMGDSNSVVFLDSNTGAYIDEETGIQSNTATEFVLAQGLGGVGNALVVPAHSLVCTLSSETVETKAASIAFGSTHVNVGAPDLFYVGETVLVYEPKGSSTAVVDIRHIAGVDTIGEYIMLDTSPSQGHRNGTTVIMPLNVLGGEYQLRPAIDLTGMVQGDVQGGMGAHINFTGLAPLMVGDLLLADQDGDLKTTTDQVVTKISAVQFDARASPTPMYSIVADLPMNMFLYEKTSKVIGLGDSFMVGGIHDTSPIVPGMPRNLDQHRDHFSPSMVLDGTGYLYGVIQPKM